MCCIFKHLRETFAAIIGDGSVVTWSDGFSGGDSTGVRDQWKT